LHNFHAFLVVRFTARASAATLLHLGFRRFTAKIQDDVFAVYLRLCKDETPLVRRLAAQSLDRWARLLADSPLKQKELLGAFKALIHDDQVGTRAATGTIQLCADSSFSILCRTRSASKSFRSASASRR
jgi:serine/threonine-protein phosphatase 2A regulatory subunit A